MYMCSVRNVLSLMRGFRNLAEFDGLYSSISKPMDL